MSLEIFWFLPTHGDGHYLGTTQGARAVDHGYLQQIAQAADRLGFGGVLIPTGRSCEDSWLGCPTAARCSTWSPAAIPTNWLATACT